MHLHSCKLKNFRRLKDVVVELAPDISIFVGANNSAKTSATQALQMFLAADRNGFSLYDFHSSTWDTFDQIGRLAADQAAAAPMPTTTLDLWFEVTAADLYLVIPLLPSMTWEGTRVGIRIEFSVRDPDETLTRFRTLRDAADGAVARLEGGGR